MMLSSDIETFVRRLDNDLAIAIVAANAREAALRSALATRLSTGATPDLVGAAIDRLERQRRNVLSLLRRALAPGGDPGATLEHVRVAFDAIAHDLQRYAAGGSR